VRLKQALAALAYDTLWAHAVPSALILFLTFTAVLEALHPHDGIDDGFFAVA
jgi:hypothetical protein